ncbi:MAG: ASCH domain-containing protein [Ramlibacter sp.]|nr:ASCH domain-containing protein [Ramlibacter sp.]
MSIPSSIQAFWREYAQALGQDPSARFYEAFHFDDNAPSADELAALVLAGTKRATASLLWSFESEAKPMPRAGDLSVVTLYSGQPVCVIETLDVKVVPFSEVDADFAATEGEGDGSLAYWQRVHTAFFERECGRLGRPFDLDAPVVCERFEVVYRSGDRG